MASKLKLWWYEQIIHSSLAKFGSGYLKVQPFVSSVESFFSITLREEELNSSKYDEFYGKRMIWNFFTSVIPLLTSEASSIKDIADALKLGIKHLDEAMLSKFAGEEEDVERIISYLKDLKSETVLLAIVKTLNDKSESRITYNRHKDCLSRFKKDGIKCVLQGLLDPKKVLMPYSEYLKLIQEVICKVVTASSPTLISRIAQMGKSKEGEDFSQLVDDIDSSTEENIDLENVSETTMLSLKESSTVNEKATLPNPDGRHSENSDSSDMGVHVFPAPQANKQLKFPKRRIEKPCPRSPLAQSMPPSDNFKFPPKVASLPECLAWGKAQSVTSSVGSRFKHEFTPLQDAYIIMGLQKFGIRKKEWKKILGQYAFPNYRTAVHLKDRWRTLLKHGSVKLDKGELVISDKYKAIIKFLSTKKSPFKESGRKTHGKTKNGSKPKKNIDNPESPDLSYLVPDDLSDSDDKKSIPLPGLEHVKRWIKTGDAVTDKKPRSRIPPLLLVKRPRPNRLEPAKDSVVASEKQSDSRDNELNTNKSLSNSVVVSPELVASRLPDRAGTSHGEQGSAASLDSDKDNAHANKTMLPFESLPILARKEYDYEKNANGKYIRKQRKLDKEYTDSKESVEKKDVKSVHSAAEGDQSDKTDPEIRNAASAKQSSDELITVDGGLECPVSAGDKTLLPPENNKEDDDFISQMEVEESSLSPYCKGEQEYSKSTLGMLQNLIHDQFQTESQSCSQTQESYPITLQPQPLQSSWEQQQISQPTLELLKELNSKREEKQSQGQHLSQVVEGEESQVEEQKMSTMTPASGSVADCQVASQATLEAGQNMEMQPLEETVPGSSPESSVDNDNALLSSQPSESQDDNCENSESRLRNEEHHLRSESDDGGPLVIDESSPGEDNNKTLVADENELRESVEEPLDVEGSTDNIDPRAMEVKQENENPFNTAEQANASDGQQIKDRRRESPALSHLVFNTDPRSPISEYYTASEGSQSDGDRETSGSSDMKEEDEANTTVVQNTTLTDADIPDNIEQWIAENPPSSSGEAQNDCHAPLSGGDAVEKISCQIPEAETVDQTQVKEQTSLDGSQHSSDSYFLLDTILYPGPSRAEPPSALHVSDTEAQTSVIKGEYVSADLLSPPLPAATAPREYKTLLDNSPILKLERVKMEPGISSCDVCMNISSDNDHNLLLPEGSEIAPICSESVVNDDNTPSSQVHSKAVDSITENISPLDLSVGRKTYLAMKSTGGKVKASRKPKLNSTAINVGAKRKLRDKSTAQEQKKAGKRKKVSSTDDSNSDTMIQNSNLQKRKRNISLHGHGTAVKLSEEDALLFGVGTCKPGEFETYGNKKRGRRKKWSQEEDDSLMAGVQRFGEGRWKNILDNCQFNNRTVVNLKDRYRVLKEK